MKKPKKIKSDSADSLRVPDSVVFNGESFMVLGYARTLELPNGVQVPLLLAVKEGAESPGPVVVVPWVIHAE